jgi:hypothetical protein
MHERDGQEATNSSKDLKGEHRGMDQDRPTLDVQVPTSKHLFAVCRPLRRPMTSCRSRAGEVAPEKIVFQRGDEGSLLVVCRAAVATLDVLVVGDRQAILAHPGH